MKKYSKYRNSGVEWIGEIPVHWDTLLLKYVIDYNKKSLPENTPNDYSFEYIEISDVNEKGEIVNKTPYIFQDSPSRCRRILHKGDVFISTVRTYLKSIGYVKEDVVDLICSTGFCVLSPRNSILSEYLFFQVLTEYFISEVISHSEGVSYPSITPTDLINIRVILPTLQEQSQIVTYLDQKTYIIDDLIQKKLRKIELLKEQRQSIINRAVTKGLKPEVRMKNSGMNWIGEIPEHWYLKKVSYLSKGMISGPFGSSLKKEYYTKTGFKIYGQEQVISDDFSFGDYYISEDKFNELKRCEIFKDDVLISCVGTFGKISLVPEKFERGIINPRLLKLTPNELIVPKYFLILLRSEISFSQLESLSRGGTMDIINLEILKQIEFPLPPIDEQHQITDYLDKKTSKIDKQVDLENRKIDLLKEYRQSLISEVVTGKIDVRTN